jgi:group I intron endonuclease
MRSGIYKITNEVTGKFYIGSSEDVDNRWEIGHKQSLNRNQHCNPRLQHSWNFYGGDKFTMTLLETVEPKELLLEREQHYLDLSPTSRKLLRL